MQVILMDDVERVGHEGDVITVADGYARNYLIPKGLAVQASKGTLKDLERRRTAIGAREGDKRVKAQSLADELGAKPIVVKARAGEGQRLHGQVTPQMIAEAAREQIHMDIDRRDIDIAEPIRELGDYLVSAKLYKDVSAQLPVSVVRDEQADKEAAEEEAAAAPARKQEPEEDTEKAEQEEEEEQEEAAEAQEAEAAEEQTAE